MKKVLLIRFSSIGDIVLTTPIVRALKKRGNYRLHILTRKVYVPIFEANPYVDEVHFFEKKISEIIPALKIKNFDFVVDLQKNLRSFMVKRALSCPSISFPKLNKEKWLLVNFKINRLPDLHIVDRYFETVKLLGIDNDQAGLDFFIPDEEHIDPAKLDENFSKKYIGFVIGGKHTTKIFPAEKVASVLSKLPHPAVLLGGTEDWQKGEEIIALSNNKLIYNACGKLSLFGSASLVKQANLIISNDTGLMHIAAAFQKPVISLWGNTVVAFGMYPYEPQHPQNVVISEVKELKCRPCSKLGYKKCPKKHFKCMMEQDVDFIVQKALRFI